MYILGIHDGHNASAILLRDGRVVAGVQEERPRGVKNAMGMPKAAIQRCFATGRDHSRRRGLRGAFRSS